MFELLNLYNPGEKKFDLLKTIGAKQISKERTFTFFFITFDTHLCLHATTYSPYFILEHN